MSALPRSVDEVGPWLQDVLRVGYFQIEIRRGDISKPTWIVKIGDDCHDFGRDIFAERYGLF